MDFQEVSDTDSDEGLRIQRLAFGRQDEALLVEDLRHDPSVRSIELVFVLGDPGYDTRCGFVPAIPLRLAAPYAVEAEVAWMVRAESGSARRSGRKRELGAVPGQGGVLARVAPRIAAPARARPRPGHHRAAVADFPASWLATGQHRRASSCRPPFRETCASIRAALMRPGRRPLASRTAERVAGSKEYPLQYAVEVSVRPRGDPSERSLPVIVRASIDAESQW